MERGATKEGAETAVRFDLDLVENFRAELKKAKKEKA